MVAGADYIRDKADWDKFAQYTGGEYAFRPECFPCWVTTLPTSVGFGLATLHHFAFSYEKKTAEPLDFVFNQDIPDGPLVDSW